MSATTAPSRTYQALRTYFSPLIRAKVSATHAFCLWVGIVTVISVPSFGPKCLQRPVCLVLPPDVRLFQSPRSGQCVCNSKSSLVLTLCTDISVPSFGPKCLQRCLCLCWSWPSGAFQSPRSGQSVCNCDPSLSFPLMRDISVPSFGPKCLQQACLIASSCFSRDFSPLVRAKVSATQ